MAVLRPFCSSDLTEVIKLFFETVHRVNATDYRSEQLDAWAPKDADLGKWKKALESSFAFVAVENGTIVGFGNIEKDGYLDCLYVHCEHIGRGIGTALCDKLESLVDSKKIVVHASMTARPFFAGRGYRFLKEQQVIRRGVVMTNFVMEKTIG